MSFLNEIIENTGSGPEVVRKQGIDAINRERRQGTMTERGGRDEVLTAEQLADLAEIDGEVAVVYTQEVDAWHEVGTMVSGAMTLEQLFELCPALDFQLKNSRSSSLE